MSCGQGQSIAGEGWGSQAAQGGGDKGGQGQSIAGDGWGGQAAVQGWGDTNKQPVGVAISTTGN